MPHSTLSEFYEMVNHIKYYGYIHLGHQSTSHFVIPTLNSRICYIPPVNDSDFSIRIDTNTLYMYMPLCKCRYARIYNTVLHLIFYMSVNIYNIIYSYFCVLCTYISETLLIKVEVDNCEPLFREM